MKACIFIVILFSSIVSYSGIIPDSTFNDIPDSALVELEPQKFLNDLKKVVNPYGSYRITYGMNSDGYFGISDNASRFGVEASMPIVEDRQIGVFAVVEFGTNLVDKDEIIVFRTDPGSEYTEEGNAVYSRLGFVGVSTRYLDFSVGKQWSVYYDVASFTDQFYAFGADGSATFNLDSDGGISGTGRANRLFLLRSSFQLPLKIGLQAQVRDISENRKNFADTYGGSIRYEPDFGLILGFSFNIVRDGVSNPQFNQPKINDRAFIGAIGYKKNNFHIAFSYSIYNNHEKLEINDSVNYYFSGSGMELYLGYEFEKNRRWKVATGFNYLRPEKNTIAGSFREMYFICELSYNFSRSSYIFTTAKINNSSDIKGLVDTTSIFAMGLRFSFGY